MAELSKKRTSQTTRNLEEKNLSDKGNDKLNLWGKKVVFLEQVPKKQTRGRQDQILRLWGTVEAS